MKIRWDISFRAVLPLAVVALALGGCDAIKEDIKALFQGSASSQQSGAPPHESWCYRTLGQTECHVRPVMGAEGSFVNVDPPSRAPMSAEEHSKIAAESR